MDGEWIKLNNNIPKDMDSYFWVHDSNGYIQLAEINEDIDGLCFCDLLNNWPIEDITHYQKLLEPKPPKIGV
jgi:hypothetical protein